jgi:hypothetical protein
MAAMILKIALAGSGIHVCWYVSCEWSKMQKTRRVYAGFSNVFLGLG